jgi:hypothetical protein
MTPLTIIPAALHAKPGDLGALVQGNCLLLPEPIARMFLTFGVRNGAELLSYLYSFPGAVAVALQWPLPAVGAAANVLHGQLRGYVDEAILNPTPQPKRVYGAIYPRGGASHAQ